MKNIKYNLHILDFQVSPQCILFSQMVKHQHV